MIKTLKIIVIGILVLMLSSCAKNTPQKEDKNDNPICKQESTKAKDWVASWRTCSGDGAVKKDGSLWQFGKVGGCDMGQMYPMDVKKTYTYHLKGKKTGDGFSGAKIINGDYRVYAIKKDGTLWGWGEGFREKPMLLSQSQNWVDFGVKWAGNGCCAHDVGIKKDGSLWIFPEDLDYAHKSPFPDLKRVGKQKDWDKVILNCCSMYAMKKDGSLWVNRDRLEGLKFIKFDHKIHCATEGKSFYKKLKSAFAKMPSQSIYNYYDEYDEMKSQKVDVGSSAGTLCLKPEIKYIF